MDKGRRWFWGLCLLLLAGCALVGGERSVAYRELADWLDIHALPDETVAVQERGAWARLTNLPLLTLPAGEDAFALLDNLQETRPDYCVALRSVAWKGARADPWFQERYHQVAVATAAGDSVSPLALYRYHPSPFDAGETRTLDASRHDGAVGGITVDSVRLSSRRLSPGEPVYVSLTLRGDAREPLDAVWRLRDPLSERVWLRETRTLPAEDWPVNGTVTARHVVVLLDALPVGEYALELALTRPNLAPLGEPVLLATLSRLPDVASTPFAPDHPLDIRAGESIALLGYDAPERVSPGETLRIALYWHALRPVRDNLMVFVHVFDPDGALVTQTDAIPVYWTYPTTAWQPGDYVRDVHVVPLDTTLPRGDYSIAVGIYNAATGERLALRDAQGATAPDDAAALYVLQVR